MGGLTEPASLISIHPMDAADTRPLRQRILRPHQLAAELVYEGDAEGLHLGAFDLGGRLLGIASFLTPAQGVWRLRGMAVVEELRGRGIGRALIEHAHAHLAGRLQGIWCNARTHACGFYERLGFVRCGDAFELPGIGEHYRMEWRG